VKSKVYTQFTRTRLYLFTTLYSGQYIADYKGYTNLYFQTVRQVDDHLFRDEYGNLIYFQTDGEGRVEKLIFEDEEYVPVEPGRGVTAVNLSIYSLYVCTLYFIIALAAQCVMMIRDRLQYWPVSAASFFALGMIACGFLLCVNNILLLFYTYKALSYEACRIHILMNWVLTAVGVVCLTGMGLTWRRGELRTHEKAFYGASAALLVIFIMTALWWNLYL